MAPTIIKVRAMTPTTTTTEIMIVLVLLGAGGEGTTQLLGRLIEVSPGHEGVPGCCLTTQVCPLKHQEQY